MGTGTSVVSRKNSGEENIIILIDGKTAYGKIKKFIAKLFYFK